ncbi:DUF2278 family protein [Streptomyces sp. NPDC091204]|uniref:DUF2278 family protein n=1 Tax=Streptomyces sp. NPDC091204 TaxID=3155299 RepID=UPI0034287446
MHDIHPNQGAPYGSQWWPENGTWQDSGTMTRRRTSCMAPGKPVRAEFRRRSELFGYRNDFSYITPLWIF